MKWLLLSLSLAGVAVYTVNTLTVTRTVVAVQTQPNYPVVRHLRSWGSYLSDLPISQKPQAPLPTSQQPTPLPPQQNASNQNSGLMPDADDQPAGSEDKSSLSGIDGAEQEPVEWAKVMLAARVHSEASVSSPTVGYYRPGTELQVVTREHGWLQLSDPVTQKRGWVFEKYLSPIDGPSPTQAAMGSTIANGFSQPLPAKAALPTSSKRSPPALRVSDDVVVTEPDTRSGRWARGGDRRRGLFMFGLFARF
jgi:hypothetical protein